MSTKTCVLEECSRPLCARGYCRMHYHRWHRNGDPHIVTKRVLPPPEVRFWNYVNKNGAGGCWLWTGGASNGYGRFNAGTGRGNKFQAQAHRYAYELLIGPIPEGLVLDHLCRTPACVNPDHLEPVTNRENALRGEATRDDACKNGHLRTPENTRITSQGWRFCLICERERRRERHHLTGSADRRVTLDAEMRRLASSLESVPLPLKQAAGEGTVDYVLRLLHLLAKEQEAEEA